MASELRVNTITSTTGVGTVTLGSGGVSFSGTPTFNDVTLSSINGNAISGTRNRIINGDMRIDQRNAGASVTPTATSYTLDRWHLEINQASKLSIQQNAGALTPPVGFTNYLGATTVSAYTAGASEAFVLRTFVEGFNFADMAWGTASAASVTLSFWVRSSLTGTFGGAFRNDSNNRSYPYTYTINVANTWEQKSVTIAGDTSGTWEKTNQRGVGVIFSLGVGATLSGTAGAWAGANYSSATGATSVVGTNGATFYLTGVQLEPGTVATPFERRSYGQELALCQRYFCKSYNQADVPGTVTRTGGIQLGSYSNSATGMNNGVGFRFPVVMRASPAVTGYDPDAANTTGQGRWDAAGVGATQGALSIGVIGDAGVGSVTIATTGRTAGAGLTVLFHYTAAIEL